MSTPLPPLPDLFVSHAVRLTDARAAGLTRSELDGPLWVRPHRGLRQWSAAPPDTWTRVAAAGALLPPGGALGGWAAAYLLDAGGTDGETAGGAALPVPLLLPPPLQLRPRPGLLRWHSRLAPDDVTEQRGLPVSARLRTAFDLARHPPLEEAVVAVDALLRARLVTVPELAAYIEDHRGWKGVPLARHVVDLADGGAESPQESRLRMIWVLGGLPRPLANACIYDREGRFLARGDLLDPEAGVVGEYDGAVHGDAERRRADYLRQERLERAGLIVIRFGAADVLRTPRATLARIVAALERGLRRDRRHDRWQLCPAR